MTYAITNACIGCQRCLSACPSGAIATDGLAVWIDITRCNQCHGAYGVPQCWAACPTNGGCVSLVPEMGAVSLTSCSENSSDYWESWFAKYTRLVGRLRASKQPSYWQQWFETYAQALKKLRTQAGLDTRVPLMP